MNRFNLAIGWAALLALAALWAGCLEPGAVPEEPEEEVAVQRSALTCSAVTATVTEHESAGRATREELPCGGGGAGSGPGPVERFRDGFGNLTKWTETGAGNWTTASLHASTSYGGGGSPVASVVNCSTGCTIAQTTAIDLTGQSAAELKFWRFVDSEFDDANDYLRVELFDGTSWNQAFNWFGGSGDTNAWRQETVTLGSQYLGKATFKVRFVSKSNSLLEYAQIDDVVITSTASVPTCPAWFTAGTHQSLGNVGTASFTLSSVATGSWTIGPCGPRCGDDVVDPGELCDGNCPTSCSDGSACTTDTLAGSAATCDARCTFSPLTTCRNADGCCPSNCNAGNDSDCVPRCGDGVVSTGERCDGNCPTSCNDQNACTTDILAGSSLACDARCVNAALGVCRHGDGCCPSGCTPSNDGDCGTACPVFTATVAAHKAAGRAYSKLVLFVTRYYATGSNDSLGTSSLATVTLYQNATNNYSLTLGAQCSQCSCTGKACGASNGCGKECDGTCSGGNACVDVTGGGNYECVAALPTIGDPPDAISASLVAAQHITVAIQQLIALQAELASVPNSQSAIGELQQRQAELQQELDTVNAQGNLQSQ